MNKTLNLLIVSLLCMVTFPGVVLAKGGGFGSLMRERIDISHEAGYRAGYAAATASDFPIIIAAVVGLAVGMAIGYWIRSRKMVTID